MLLQSQQAGRQRTMTARPPRSSPATAPTPRPGTSCSPRLVGRTLTPASSSSRLGRLQPTEFQSAAAPAADLVFVNQGVTFSVYSDRRGVEKIFPFDLGSAGRRPRNGSRGGGRAPPAASTPLNLFLHDVYHDLPHSARGRRAGGIGLSSRSATGRRWSASTPPGGQYVHVVGTDTGGDRRGSSLVLEDNGRCAVRRQLRAGKPRRDEESVPRAVPKPATSAASRRTTRSGCATPLPVASPGAAGPALRRRCCRQLDNFSLFRSHSFLYARPLGCAGAATCSSTTTRFNSPHDPAGRKKVDVIYPPTTTTFGPGLRFGPTASSGVPGACSPPTGPATSRWPTRFRHRRGRQGHLPPSWRT